MPEPNGTRAIVLAFPQPSVVPLDRLAGLSLVLRAVLTLRDAGAGPIEVAVPPGDVAVSEHLRADARVGAGVRVREAASQRSAVLAAAPAPGERVVCASFEHMIEPKALAELVRAARRGDPVVATPMTAGCWPFVVTSALVEALAGEGAPSLEDALAELLRTGSALPLAPAPRWAADLRREDERRRAVHELFEACRKPVDGIVARHLNRHVSLFVSRRIVNVPVTPNAISVATLLLGMTAAVLVSRGTYAAMVAGALTMQIQSILDGVDGELARVRFQRSRLGEWLDTISDDASNILFIGGTSLAALHLSGPARWLGVAGAVGVGCLCVAVALYYRLLVRLGSGDFYTVEAYGAETSGLTRGIGTVVRYVLKKDFGILGFFVAALLGILFWVLPVVMAGAIAAMFNGIRLTVRHARTSGARR